MNKEQVKKEIIEVLEKKGFTVEQDEKGIVFSLTMLGLSCVWASIDNKEIEYYREMIED